MMALERIERLILIILIAALLAAVAISFHKRSRTPIAVKIEKFDPQRYKEPPGLSSSSEEKININYAGVEDLMKIKGVGNAIAGRVVEYRYQKGGFASIDDLKNVKGVSVGLFEKIKNKITVE